MSTRTVKQNVYEIWGGPARCAMELDVSVAVVCKYMRNNNISGRSLLAYADEGRDVLPFIHLLYKVRKIAPFEIALCGGRSRRPHRLVNDRDYAKPLEDHHESGD